MGVETVGSKQSRRGGGGEKFSSIKNISPPNSAAPPHSQGSHLVWACSRHPLSFFFLSICMKYCGEEAGNCGASNWFQTSYEPAGGQKAKQMSFEGGLIGK